MKDNKFYSEDELVQMYQNQEITLVDFIDKHSAEWQDEYMAFCEREGKEICEDSANDFIEWKGRELEKAMEEGNA